MALRFNLRTLILLMVGAGLLLTTLKTWGILALIPIWVVAVVWMGSVYVSTQVELRPAADLVAALFLPCLCLVFDPLLFRHDAKLQAVVYPMLLFEMLIFAAWVWGFPVVRRRGGMVGGILMLGGLAAAVVGLLLIIPALIGVFFYGIGLLGFTPWITSLVFFRNAREAIEWANHTAQSPSQVQTQIILGVLCFLMLLSLCICLAIYAISADWPPLRLPGPQGADLIMKHIPW